MISNTAERLKKLMASRNIRQVDIVERTGIGKSAVSQYVSGKVVPKQDKLYLLAKALNVSPTWLMGYDVPMSWGDNHETTTDIYTPILKKVPMLGYAAAGQPLENLDGQDTYYVETNSKYEVDFCITVRGDSMINAGINDGDIVFVRSQPEVENGQIACIELDGEKVCIKRFYKNVNEVMLVSENPKYAPLYFNEENCSNFRVLGLAVIKQSEIY